MSESVIIRKGQGQGQKQGQKIIKKKDKLLGRLIPYFTCKIWNKNTQYVVLKKHDILGIFIPYFAR